jgi:septal ring factor EnvC (AmiA/AmiB activator)
MNIDTGWILSAIGLFGALVAWYQRRIDQRFQEIRSDMKDFRLDIIDRFEKIDARFKEIDSRFKEVEVKLEKMQESITALDKRLSRIEYLVEIEEFREWKQKKTGS